MKVGIFAGGYKPFTLAHFSMIALAARENDRAILVYGMSGRSTSGHDFEYTDEMARNIFEINKKSIEREMSNVDVIEADQTPLSSVFRIIENVLNDKKIQRYNLNIEPVDSLTVYDGPDDIKRYTKYVEDHVKRKKYFGNMIESGSLMFDSGPGEKRGYDGMLHAIKEWKKIDVCNVDIKNIRGTIVRKMISSNCGFEEFKKMLPPIYTEEESFRIFNIMSKKG